MTNPSRGIIVEDSAAGAKLVLLQLVTDHPQQPARAGALVRREKRFDENGKSALVSRRSAR